MALHSPLYSGQMLPYVGSQAVIISAILSGVWLASAWLFLSACKGQAKVWLLRLVFTTLPMVAGTNIYFPDAWLATALICFVVICAQMVYVVAMQRVCCNVKLPGQAIVKFPIV